MKNQQSMNDFLYAHKKIFHNSEGEDLRVFLDVNLKNNKISTLRFEGKLLNDFALQIEKITHTFLNQNLQSIPQIKIENSLPLWLFYRALDEYQGHVALPENNCKDIICLCFGINKDDLQDGVNNMAGRACGSCLPFIRKRDFKKILGMYPGVLVVKIDQLIKSWPELKQSNISIVKIENEYLDVKMSPYEPEKLKNLSDYLYENLSVRFFFRGVL